MSGQKTITLPQFLTAEQISEATRLFAAEDEASVTKIQVQVIEPNMLAINAKLGQSNDPRYLAYAVVYVLSQARKAQS